MISDLALHGFDRPIDPHHLSTARRQLRTSEVISETPGRTRGGGVVSVLHFTDLTGRKSKFNRAAARKRLLQARYLSWANTLALLGPAGEAAAHSAILAAAPESGLRVERLTGGDVGTIFGRTVPGGPLDDAAHLQITDRRGVTTSSVTLLIEVKNVRDWIYPETYRLHQLLYKAAKLQAELPDVSFVPVFICRRAHLTTYWLAKVLGFYVANANAQFLPQREETAPKQLEEVRSELGFLDLTTTQEPHPLLRWHFAVSLPRIARDQAASWAAIGSSYLDYFEELRRRSLSPASRQLLKRDLLRVVMEARSPTWVPDEVAGFVDDDADSL